MRNIGGIPEEALLRQYAGKYSKHFETDHIRVYSPSRGGQANIAVLRWHLAFGDRITLHYTGTQKSVLVTRKIHTMGGGATDWKWDEVSSKLIPLCDPSGMRTSEEFILELFQDKIKGYCANPDS